jgi:hypothetical protein
MIFCYSFHEKKPGYDPGWLKTDDVHHLVQQPRENHVIVSIKVPCPTVLNALGIAR